MPTECSAEQFDFGIVEGRAVEAAFDAGLVTSDAGGLLLGATDRVIDLVDRFAACFRDRRRQDLVEHALTALIGQRVFGIALGYEDLNDHDDLRHDPVMAVLAGKLSSKRETCAALAGKSTLNRLELSRLQPTRYHKIAYDEAAIEALPVTLFLEAHARPPNQIILDLDATDDPLHGHQEGLCVPKIRFGVDAASESNAGSGKPGPAATGQCTSPANTEATAPQQYRSFSICLALSLVSVRP